MITCRSKDTEKERRVKNSHLHFTYLLPKLGQEIHPLLFEQPLDRLSPWSCRSTRSQVHSGPISARLIQRYSRPGWCCTRGPLVSSAKHFTSHDSLHSTSSPPLYFLFALLSPQEDISNSNNRSLNSSTGIIPRKLSLPPKITFVEFLFLQNTETMAHFSLCRIIGVW